MLILYLENQKMLPTYKDNERCWVKYKVKRGIVYEELII